MVRNGSTRGNERATELGDGEESMVNNGAMHAEGSRRETGTARRIGGLLVVDPDPRTHRACDDLFARQFLVTHAASGHAALEQIERAAPVVVVTELALPDQDGLALVRRLRREHPTMVLVVLTGEPTARAAAQAHRLGVDDFILKDGDSAAYLRHSVRHALERHAHQAEVERLLIELTELNEAFLTNMVELERDNQLLQERLEPLADAGGAVSMLVVDDEVAIVAVLETLLRSQGYVVDGANSGAEARALLAARRFDIVLTDKNLGDASGVDLIREIHATSPETRVLLMTGFATVESAVDAMHFGAVGYLRKPFEDLMVVVNRVDEVVQQMQADRDRARYVHAFQTRNADFLARYRLLKTKLMTLQRPTR